MPVKMLKSASWWRYNRPISVFTNNSTDQWKLCMRTPKSPKKTDIFLKCHQDADFCKTHFFFNYSFRFVPEITGISTEYRYRLVIKNDLSDNSYSILVGLDWLLKFAGLVCFEGEKKPRTFTYIPKRSRNKCHPFHIGLL